MKIQFDKIGSSPKPFEIVIDNVLFQGSLKKSGYHLLALSGTIKGDIQLDCDRCGKGYMHTLDSTLKLSLSDHVLKDKEDLDIIEFLDGVVDITYILESEINAQKSTYHYCPTCGNSEEDFEIEF
jgi:uncharacterized metal-binding protein YceD (DUF177 family)